MSDTEKLYQCPKAKANECEDADECKDSNGMSHSIPHGVCPDCYPPCTDGCPACVPVGDSPKEQPCEVVSSPADKEPLPYAPADETCKECGGAGWVSDPTTDHEVRCPRCWKLINEPVSAKPADRITNPRVHRHDTYNPNVCAADCPACAWQEGFDASKAEISRLKSLMLTKEEWEFLFIIIKEFGDFGRFSMKIQSKLQKQSEQEGK